jgi:hypothetical protein
MDPPVTATGRGFVERLVGPPVPDEDDDPTVIADPTETRLKRRLTSVHRRRRCAPGHGRD